MGRIRELLFASSAHSVAGLGSTAYVMRQAARSRPPPSCARRPVSLVRRARPTATTCNCRRCSFTRSGVILHLLMQRQWPCKFLVLAALSAMWGVRRTHWLAQLLRVEEEMSNNFEAFDASCRATGNRLTPVVPHDGDGVDRSFPACGRVVWVPRWRGDTFWACTRVLPQLKVVLFLVSCFSWHSTTSRHVTQACN